MEKGALSTSCAWRAGGRVAAPQYFQINLRCAFPTRRKRGHEFLTQPVSGVAGSRQGEGETPASFPASTAFRLRFPLPGERVSVRASPITQSTVSGGNGLEESSTSPRPSPPRRGSEPAPQFGKASRISALRFQGVAGSRPKELETPGVVSYPFWEGERPIPPRFLPILCILSRTLGRAFCALAVHLESK
jgi:hypothetical protein